MTSQTRIAVITGARSDYGYLKPLMKLIHVTPQTKLLTIVTGMHLSHAYGYTVNQLINDGFTPNASIETLLNTDTTIGTAKSIALGILGVIEHLPQLQPDFSMILGDRFESFAAGIAVLHSSSVLVHLHGGDVGAAIFDNYYRRGLTNMAQIHFVATLQSMQRVLAQGVNPEHVYLSGSTTLDNILSFTPLEKTILAQELDLDPKKQWVLAIYHPSKNQETSIHELKTMLQALTDTLHTETTEIIMIYPNADPGSQTLIAQTNKPGNHVKLYKSLPYHYYLSLLHHALFMIGNSSSGIIEAPALHLPFINIGNRQENREQGKNVINTPATLHQIQDAIHQAVNPEFKTFLQKHTSPYGDGNASTRILNKLLELPTNKNTYSSTYHDNLKLITRLQGITDFTFNTYPKQALNAYQILEHYT